MALIYSGQPDAKHRMFDGLASSEGAGQGQSGH